MWYCARIEHVQQNERVWTAARSGVVIELHLSESCDGLTDPAVGKLTMTVDRDAAEAAFFEVGSFYTASFEERAPCGD